ncbi:ABC transporter substrate-binding protein [Modestobacter sp. I12A-02628]|uniref:ABC transporter substrate-binding protein n=1 Tax=Goekera deserti TaxID=2497753 RepID=A0A7K3WEH1_9ACTN|nr:ABC transporter substrate-binding protein [Goekera deserti]MPQ98347.1 ABC transporter substrate-binding protein [Goekera deserti]NDI48174.1 ABC transporter substrate-binding protein [Goekera deserti]NEL53923.1 ABC transporter substrate-binding protein [Goekera deserti]
MRSTTNKAGLVAGALLASIVLSACGSDEESSAAAGPSGEVGATDLAAAGCPDTVVVQTDWNPESEHGGLYESLGEDYVVDADTKTVSGTLIDSAGDSTGVKLEIRAGGPAIGFQTVTAQMYADDSIDMGYIATDEAIQNSAEQPTTAVLAPLEKSPTMIMWDPSTYPDVQSIADLKGTGATVRYFEGSAYMAYLTGAGILDPGQVDGSYDGTPAGFVAAEGKAAQQGFASAEPYIYENEVDSWGKPVDYQLVYDAGFQPYQSSMSVRTEDLEGMSECLTALVPVMQQADVDYLADPTRVNAIILELVEQYDTGWVYTQGVADYSVQTQAELGLVGNGPDDTHGNMDEARVQTLIDQTTPIFTEQGTAPADGITPADLVTNEFIDMSISVAG